MNNTPLIWHTVDSLKAKTTEDGDCWRWDGPFNGSSGPRASHGGKVHYVRRLMMQLHGKNLDGMIVTPTCGDSTCVNPEHLKVITRAEHQKRLTVASNSGTALLRKRQKVAEHKRRTVGKLTMEQAREIRASNDTHRVLCERYGVTRRVISRIRQGIGWREYSNPFAGLMA